MYFLILQDAACSFLAGGITWMCHISFDLCRLLASFAFHFLCQDYDYIFLLEVAGFEQLGYSQTTLDVHTNLHK